MSVLLSKKFKSSCILKIGIVTYYLNIGGVESLIFSLAKAFKKLGHEIEIIETDHKGEWNYYFRENGFNVKSFKLSTVTVPFFHAKRIASYLNSFDVLFINDSPYAMAGLGLLKNEIKVFPILHNNLQTMIDNALASFGQWNKIICVSPGLKSTIDKYSDKEIGFFIPNSVEQFRFVERDYSKKISILYVGRLDNTQKGIFLLPEIASLLIKRNIDFEIRIIGDGPDSKLLERMIQQQYLQNHVIFLGPLSHDYVNKEMMQNHFLILPSNYEGFGIVIIEAMSSGLIPIVSNLPGYTDICIQDQITGFLCMPGNADSFAQTIEMALNDRQLMKKISNNAYELVSAEFNIKKIASTYIKLIEGSAVGFERSNKIDSSILISFPYLPILVGRIIRKLHFYLKFSF